MKQSRSASLIESVGNIAVGFGLSLLIQATVLPWLLGVAIPFRENLAFAILMTGVSIGRSYLLRRVFEALHIRVRMSPFMLACIAERRRQRDAEGWDTAHDDAHRPGELAAAGAAYAFLQAEHFADVMVNETRPPAPRLRNLVAADLWPWDWRWWKPADPRRNLVKAAALIIAEGEKLDRVRARTRLR